MDVKPTFSLLLCGLLTASIVPGARAADVRFGNVLPTGEVHRAKVTSLREARFRNIVAQDTDFSCGSAALATLLRYAYDIDVDE